MNKKPKSPRVGAAYIQITIAEEFDAMVELYGRRPTSNTLERLGPFVTPEEAASAGEQRIELSRLSRLKST